MEVDDAEITMDDVDLTEPEVEPLAESEFVVEAIEVRRVWGKAGNG